MNISNFYEQILTKFPSILANFVLRFVNWLFQGMLVAGQIEQTIKIFIDLLLTLIFSIILQNFIQLNISLIVAFFLAHSFNWILATNIWSTRIKKYDEIQNDSKYYMDFLISLQRKVQKQNSIYGAAIFGSMSTGKFRTGSDIDVKLFRKPGFLNIIHSYLLLFYFRTKANFCMIPLDIYVIDNINNYILKKDEVPLILHDTEKTVEGFYKQVKHLIYE